MKMYMADTHGILWFAGGELRRLGKRARRLFDGLGTARTGVAVSVVTLWEIAMLHDAGLIRLEAGFSTWTNALQSLRGLSIESLTLADVEEARTLRDLPDPHDRLIAGTALRLGVPLITADRRLSAHPRLSTIW